MCFVEKTTIFPLKRDSQCQNSADILAENTPNASKISCPFFLPKPKSFGFLKKKSLWMFVVRGSNDRFQSEPSPDVEFNAMGL